MARSGIKPKASFLPEASFLNEIEINALRTILIALRKKKRAKDIWQESDVDQTHYFNFVHKKAGDQEGFRRGNVPNVFQRRMINYIIKQRFLVNQLDVKNELEIIRKKWEDNAVLEDTDFVFKQLKSIGATKIEDCKAICRELSGNYDVYRFVSNPLGMVHRSHLKIYPFNPYEKVPRFTNQMVTEPGKLRVIEGNIIQIGYSSSYCLFGYVRTKTSGSPSVIIGTKVMILTKLPKKPNSCLTLMGPYYTSGSEEIYNTGATRAIRTKREFDENENDRFLVKIEGTIASIQNSAAEHEIKFDLSDLALRFPAEALIGGMIFSSLEFNVRSPRGKRLP
jgi:hypothetical protein